MATTLTEKLRVAGETHNLQGEVAYILDEYNKFLTLDPETPFESQNEFLELTGIAFTIGCALREKMIEGLFGNVVLQNQNRIKDYARHKNLRTIARMLMDGFKELKEAKLALTEPKPRVLRWCEKMGADTIETDIIVTAFAHQLFYSHGGSLGRYIILANVVDVLGYDIVHTFRFTQGKKPWMTENVYQYFDQRPAEAQPNLSPEVLVALISPTLSEEALLKIDGTCLADVINEEFGFMEVEEEKQDVSDGGAPKEGGEQQQPQSTEEGIGENEESKEEFSLHSFIKETMEEDTVPSEEVPAEEEDVSDSELKPFRNDLDYLEAQIQWLKLRVRINQLEREVEASKMHSAYGLQEMEQRIRGQQAEERVMKKKANVRLELTKKKGAWMPRVERLCKARNLDSFERDVLLLLMVAQFVPLFSGWRGSTSLSVRDILSMFCNSFEEEIEHRKYFYKSSTLVSEGILQVQNSNSLSLDMMDCAVNIDRRMLDYALGLNTEFSELVEGSHLYAPVVKLEDVVMVEDKKDLIVNTVSKFSDYKVERRRAGFDAKMGHGGAIVLLFHGASGTGKTMMANALANHMNKRILLINFPSLGTMAGDENLKVIFREAKINDAILFFDECESIFESRDRGNYSVNLLLTEFERHDGLIIMATNRAFDLDEAMHRRVTVSVEFEKPDAYLRKRIWEANVPPNLKLAPDVDFAVLAHTYELTGGFILNAMLSALSIAVARKGKDNAVVSQADLVKGCKLQLRGRLRMVDFHRRVVPTHGIDSLVLSDQQKDVLNEIVSFEKARDVLFTQWGFDRTLRHDRGTTVLFHGEPGTGKSVAAEAIAFSMGKPLKVVNSAELMSKWVGESAKNIDSVFEEAKMNDAVLMFDEAEGIFAQRIDVSSSSTDRYANMETGLLLWHMENYPGVVVLCTNKPDSIDKAFWRRIKFKLEFPIPGQSLRERLWRKLIPKEAPLAEDVDFKVLAQQFPQFTGGYMKSAIIRAAASAALHEDPNMRKITMRGLVVAATREQQNLATTNQR